MTSDNSPLRHSVRSLPTLATPSLAERLAIPGLLLAFVVFYLLPLMSHGLWIPDETRYAQIGQEMLLSGNWVGPHFMGIRYFEKPIAGYWMIALGQAIFGENLFGVRIASALSTGISICLAYLIARRLWNTPRISAAAALLYMSFGLIAGQAGYANLDPQFTLWVNLSLVAVWFAIDSQTSRSRLLAWALLGAACGMGLMTKGFLALLLPVLITLPYMLWQRRFAELLRYGPVAVLVAVAISLPWVLAVHAREPDFWRFFFWHEHIRRFAAGEDAQHARPWWFYLPLMFAASLPWAVLLPSTLLRAWRERREPKTAFLALWFLLPLVFFSASSGKLPTYIMPCLLPLALLMAKRVNSWLEGQDSRALRLNGAVNTVLAAAALLALAYLQTSRQVYQHAEMFSLLLACVVLTTWLIANSLQILRPLTLWAMPALGIGMLVALLPAAMPASIVDSKMPDQFIAEHQQALGATHTLLSNDLGAASALSWRLRRPEVVLFNTVGELKYGLGDPAMAARKVSLEDIGPWLAEARSKGSIGVVIRVNGKQDLEEIEALPKDAEHYRRGKLEIFIIPQSQP
ncbi:lipid IV(A) 4-amino-4-deoxy-L-arabinosyltransferase [Pantoea sp. Cy-639]|uniref:lipid IV(A) 4-amino-4-deoxy-L-arabinosyltransferase n=1 Tax=Pantoea sp. Cy-639 TaxID=2608360 RepID=UPI00141FFE23|nr:lipid IV(A) 4-amino-4-deoxy-L-arabinosyltransferase [Pantoea sp. Cy-639]NIF19639.1 lipid IV(A) 4-amino-4-deoxy-L-arabinosyltransferase [Pantoea sp. Cy-639]